MPNENRAAGGKEKANMDSKSISFSHWCAPSEKRAEINVSRIGTGGDQYQELRDRIRFCVYSGAAHIQFNPTPAEALELIAALQWALEAELVEVAA